jgi:hypothetical protein
MIGISDTVLGRKIKYEVELAARRLSGKEGYEDFKNVFDAVSVGVAKVIADNNAQIKRDLEELIKPDCPKIKTSELF